MAKEPLGLSNGKNKSLACFLLHIVHMDGKSSIRLIDEKEKILSLWADRCRKEVPAAETEPSFALRDSLPHFLEHLSEALSTKRRFDLKVVLASDDEAKRIGEQHGADRADNKNYELTEVIFEYHILREVIFQILEIDGPLAPILRDIILNAIEQGVNDAAVRFSEIHTDIQQGFVNTLTHDLKTPITAAKMSAELVLRRSDIPGLAIIVIKKIVVSMNRLDSMIRDLLDNGRIRAGEQLSLQFIPCDLNLVVRQVVEEMSIIHGDRFIFDSKETIEGCFGCDGIRRAVENLVGNAVKYSTQQTPVTVSLKREKMAVELTVHNEGPPISENEIPKLFQQFHRSESAETGTKVGWGLGLTLVKGVVDAHKGKVRVESKEGKGTSFIIDIPFSENNLDQRPETRDQRPLPRISDAQK